MTAAALTLSSRTVSDPNSAENQVLAGINTVLKPLNKGQERLDLEKLSRASHGFWQGRVNIAKTMQRNIATLRDALTRLLARWSYKDQPENKRDCLRSVCRSQTQRDLVDCCGERDLDQLDINKLELIEKALELGSSTNTAKITMPHGNTVSMGVELGDSSIMFSRRNHCDAWTRLTGGSLG